MRRIAIAAVIGCGSAPAPHPAAPAAAPTCDELRPHMLDVLRANATPEDRAIVDAEFDRFFAVCVAEPWPAELRSCLARSNSVADNAACQRAPRVARGVDLGGAECSAVVDHVAQVAGPHLPDGFRKSVDAMCSTQTRAAKACMLDATTLDAVAACRGR